VVAALLLVTGCNPTRYVNEGEHLVVKNVIHLSSGIKSPEEFADSNAGGVKRALVYSKKQMKQGFGSDEIEEPEVSEEDLLALLRQKPNRKVAGIIPFHLAAWNTANRMKDGTKRKNFLQNTVGEAPVLFEQTLFERSTDQIERFMKSSGYFRSRVEAVAIKDENTVEMHYYVYSGKPYRLRKLSFALEDTALRTMVSEKELNSKLNRGDRFDTKTFEQERSRLTTWMKDHGYYTFEKIHVIFDIDTNVKGMRYDVAVRLRNLRESKQVNGKDSIVSVRHVKYRINDVFINPVYDAQAVSQVAPDTISIRGYTILSRGKPPVRPFRLARTVRITPGDLYSTKQTQYTYGRLKSLNNFRFIDIRYEPVESGEPLLDTRINLSMAPKQSVTVEATGTNRSGNLGISGSVNYQNKNLLRGAEQLNVSLFGGLEAQRTVTQTENSSSETIETFTPFNTYQIGMEVRLDIPDFLFQKTTERLAWFKEPKTSIAVTVDRQVRPDYLRDLLNASYFISGRIRDQDQLTFAPVDISLIQLDKDPEFELKLQNTNNSLLINSFNDHLIPASRLSYSYSTQDLDNELKNFYYYKANLEWAGNLARLASQTLGGNFVDSTNSYLINNIRFAQYVKVDLDAVKVNVLDKNTRFVYRFYGGVGVPLTNLNALPFDRSFFGGGSNGIRAWNIRTLGPGSAADTNVIAIDQVGEMHLELNLEYRLGLTDIVEAAVFADIGNIWLLRYDPQRPNAEFSVRRFPEDLAIAPGMGLRLNFNFFIIRLDWGMQLRNPALPAGERWAFQPWLFQPKEKTNEFRAEASRVRVDQGLDPLPTYRGIQSTLNLAIGYPF